MIADDADSVLTIYEDGMRTGNATFNTSVPTWEEWDRGHRTSCRFVATSHDDTIVGWVALTPISARSAYAGVAEVSVYVSASARGRGIGTQLLQQVIASSEAEGVWTLQAGIFPENTASVAVHHKLGFRTVGVRERIGKLNGTWRDVLLLERRSEKIE